MNPLPDPLHPAIVHFPIVLILLGTFAAAVAVFWRRHQMPVIAAVLLAFGAIGTWVAVETGKSDGGLVESASPQVESLLDSHEDWAKRTLTIAAIAALTAAGSVGLARFPRAARAVGVLAAMIALAASYAVYETGHRGGALVYKHAAGVSTNNSQPAVTVNRREEDRE
jgi:uncharacterized membrane protein